MKQSFKINNFKITKAKNHAIVDKKHPKKGKNART